MNYLLTSGIIQKLIQARLMLIEKVTRIFIGFFASTLMIRYLGPESFGILSFSLSILSLFLFINQLGLQEIIVREISHNQKEIQSYISTAILIRLFSSCLLIFLIIIISWAYTFDTENGKIAAILIIVASSSLIFTSFDSLQCIHYVESSFNKIAKAKFASFIIASSLKILLVVTSSPLILFTIPVVIEACVLVYLLKYPRYFRLRNILRSVDIVRAIFLFKQGIPIGLSLFVINLQLRLDQLMLERFLGFREVGLYAVAVRLTELWYMVPTLAVSVLLPYFVKLSKNDTDSYMRSLFNFFGLAFWAGILYISIWLFFGEFILTILFGDKFIEVYHIVAILVWCVVFASQGTVCTIWQIVEHKQKYRLYIQLYALLINIILNFILIPMFGVNGAAFATLLTLFFTTWLLPLFFIETRAITKLMIGSIIFKFNYQ